MNRLTKFLSIVLLTIGLTSCSIFDKKVPTSSPEEVTKDFYRQLVSGSKIGTKLHIAQDSFSQEDEADIQNALDIFEAAKAALELYSAVSDEYISTDLLDYMEFEQTFNDGEDATVQVTIDTTTAFGLEDGDIDTTDVYLTVEDGEWKIYDIK